MRAKTRAREGMSSTKTKTKKKKKGEGKKPYFAERKRHGIGRMELEENDVRMVQT